MPPLREVNSLLQHQLTTLPKNGSARFSAVAVPLPSGKKPTLAIPHLVHLER